MQCHSFKMLKVLPCVLWVFLISNVVGAVDNPLTHSCPENSHEKRLYVSTVDGGLTALDVNGERLWSYTTQQPLFKSTLSYSEASEAVPNLIPGLNRELYHWDGIKLQTLPFTADDLIDSTHLRESQGQALVGSKTKEVVGINLQTGKALYECTPERCHRYDNNSLIQRIDVLKVGVSRVTVREASELTGEEMWNFTVGDLQLSLVEGVEDEFSCHTSAQLPWELQVDTLTGVLSAVARSSKQDEPAMWQIKLSAPIVDVWLHDGGRLERVQLVSQSAHVIHSHSLMLLQYNNQYYIQPVVSGPGRRGVAITKAGVLGHDNLDGVSSSPEVSPDVELANHHVMFEDLYYLLSLPLEVEEDSEASGDTGTKALTLYNDGFMQMCTAGPKGLAVYFHLDIERFYGNCGSGEDNESGSACPAPTMEQISVSNQQETLLSRIWSQVRNAINYVLLAIFVAALSHIHHLNHYRRLVSESNGSLHPNTVLRPLRSVFSGRVVERLCSDSFSPTSSSETLSSSSQSMETLAEPRTIARFDSDYELKGQLGKGGFGVVYHVQNKLDGGEYAIKRIKLPTNKSAKDKVMREVHALARLEHPRIVRYFHSWVEKAPAGWTEMEEWMPLSRRASCGGDAQSRPLSEAVTNTNHEHTQTWEDDSHPLINLSQINNNSSMLGSPCPSFNSLNHTAIHSVLPPAVTNESRSSSFVIEFKEDGQLSGSGSQLGVPPVQEGCFSRDLLNRDELSAGSSCSDSTEDREREDSLTDLMVEPPTYLFIQMQLCRKESLRDWLAKNIYNRKKLMVMHFFEQTLEAVLYVHKKGMMHRDLKPSNIFFSLEGQVKVGDFGLVTGSAFANFGSSYLALKSLGDDHKQHTGNIGTHFYISPEQLSGTKYNNKVDIFALGVIFFELLYPFSTQMERVKELDNLRNQKFPPRFKTHLSLEADFVEWLMTPSVSKRPLAQEVADSQRLTILRETYARAEVKLVPKL